VVPGAGYRGRGGPGRRGRESGWKGASTHKASSIPVRFVRLPGVRRAGRRRPVAYTETVGIWYPGAVCGGGATLGFSVTGQTVQTAVEALEPTGKVIPFWTPFASLYGAPRGLSCDPQVNGYWPPGTGTRLKVTDRAKVGLSVSGDPTVRTL